MKVWLARYFFDLPATRSPNIGPDGTTAKMRVEITEIKN